MRIILRYIIFVAIVTWVLALLDLWGFVEFSRYMAFGAIILTGDDFVEISFVSLLIVSICFANLKFLTTVSKTSEDLGC